VALPSTRNQPRSERTLTRILLASSELTRTALPRGQHRFQMRLFGGEIALGSNAFSADGGHHPRAAPPRHQARPLRAQRCHHQAQHQTVARG
jgi:hypothetical protein